MLIIASMLAGHGPTGVETHIGQIAAQARAHGLPVCFVSARGEKD